MNDIAERNQNGDGKLAKNALPLLESSVSAVKQGRDLDALATLTTALAILADGDIALYRQTHLLRVELKGRRR